MKQLIPLFVVAISLISSVPAWAEQTGNKAPEITELEIAVSDDQTILQM